MTQLPLHPKNATHLNPCDYGPNFVIHFSGRECGRIDSG